MKRPQQPSTAMRKAARTKKKRRLGFQRLESRRLLAAQPIISEFMSNNVTSIEDGYGNSPDWIELYNAGDAAVDLAGYHLTDNPSDLNKWEFPSSTVLQPGGFLIVFASSRGLPDPLGFHHTSFQLGNNGDYLALTSPSQNVLSEFGDAGADYPPQATDISFGIAGSVLVSGNSVAEVLAPIDASLGESWTSNTFNGLEHGFALGRASIGYENSPGSGTSYTNSIQTTVDSGTTNVYVRAKFEVEDASDANDLQLRLQYDDGAVVYLNGTKILSLNAPTPLDYNTPATQTHDDALALAGETFDLTPHLNLLVDGQNTLAIHALNRPSSSDFLNIPQLTSQSIAGSKGYLASPTPGSANALTQELGPRISNVAPSSVVAEAGQPLTITAEISDFTSPLVSTSPQLHYRIMYAAEQSLAMVDDGSNGDAVAGDGEFTAQIPASALTPGEMVRWSVTASDTIGVTTRAPRFLDQLDSAEYFGTIVSDPSIDTDLPIFHWYLQNESAASTNLGTRASLFVDGEFYDNISVNNHGQSTRGSAFPKKSFDFDANSANKFRIWQEFDRVSDFNLITNYADQTKLRNTLTYDLFAQADYAHHLANSVMVYRNGGFYGLYDVIEEGDTEYLDRLGFNPENALYKVNNRVDSSSNNVEKKSREYEDHSDFQLVVDAVQNLTGSAATTWDFDHLDIADMINYLAIHNVAQSHDFGHKNMYWYRDTLGTGLWSVLPWDQDLSLGHQWDRNVSPSYFKDDLITNLNIYLGGNKVFQRLFADPTFKEMYLRRVRSLTDQFYGLEGSPAADSYIGQHIVALESRVAEEAALDANLWGIHPNFTRTPAEGAQQLLDEFIPLRRSFINNHSDVPASQVDNPTIVIDANDYDADPVSGQQLEEYIRLNNPNGFAVDISGWQLSGGIAHTFKGGTVLPAGGSLYVAKDVVAFLGRTSGPSAGQQLFVQGNYEGQLTFTGETVDLSDTDGSVVDSLTTPATAPTPMQQFLRVTEINYNPLVADTEFLEFTNISSDNLATPLDLTGVSISDGPSSPFMFAAGTTLAAGESILVVQDRDAMLAAYPSLEAASVAGEYMGKLSDNGERIKVVGAGGETLLDVTYSDGDPWPIAADGKGASLELIDPATTPIERLDKPYSWAGSAVAGGTPNASRLAPPPIQINEILAHTDEPNLDSIELYNPSDQPVDISGWFLSDSGRTPLKYEIADGTILAAGGYIVFDESNFNPTPQAPGDNDFALSGSGGDSVWLSIADGNGLLDVLVDQLEFGATFNGETVGRPADGTNRAVPLRQPSLGFANDIHATSPLVVTEINYHPSEPSSEAIAIDPAIKSSDLEFVELANHSEATIDLTNWRLRGTSDFNLPAESIAPAEVLLIIQFDPEDITNADRLDAFRTHYGIDSSVRLLGPMSPSLDNSYGIVKLQRPDEAPVDEPTVTPRVLVDEIFYDDLSAWPETADGDGPSLQRTSPNALGNAASSWQAALPTPGVTRFLPEVERITINSGRNTRSELTSIEVYFDSLVDLTAAEISLTSATSNTPVAALEVMTTPENGKTTAVITFTGGSAVINRAVGPATLVDGNYRLNIPGSAVVSLVGGAGMAQQETLGEVASDRFFRKFGDHDGANGVGLLDFAAFRRTFGRASGDNDFRSDFDGDGDGVISLLDFAEFRRGYGV